MQRNENVLNKDDLQTIGDNMDVDHLQDKVLIFCLMPVKIEFLLFKAEAMDMELEPNPSPDCHIAPMKSGHQRKFPCHFKDYIPSLPMTLPHMPEHP
jgi:hypothetical protein